MSKTGKGGKIYRHRCGLHAGILSVCECLARGRVYREVLVKLKSGESLDSLMKKNNDIVLKETINLSYGNLYLLKSTNKSMSMARLRTVIESLSEVEYAEPNYVIALSGLKVS